MFDIANFAHSGLSYTFETFLNDYSYQPNWQKFELDV